MALRSKTLTWTLLRHFAKTVFRTFIAAGDKVLHTQYQKRVDENIVNLKLTWKVKYNGKLPPCFYIEALLTCCMSWLISFAWVYSSCKNNPYPQWDSNPIPHAYDAKALPIAPRDMISTIDKILNAFDLNYLSLLHVRHRNPCIVLILHLYGFAVWPIQLGNYSQYRRLSPNREILS